MGTLSLQAVDAAFDRQFAASPAWTAPFHGMQHLSSSIPSTWATVSDYGTWAKCAIYTPGCGFEPRRSVHANAEEARQHAERAIATLEARA